MSITWVSAGDCQMMWAVAALWQGLSTVTLNVRFATMRNKQVSIEDNISGRKKALAAMQLLLSDTTDSEIYPAMMAVRANAAAVLGLPQTPDIPEQFSAMDEQEAKAFRNKTCVYSRHYGTQWQDIPRRYIETIADFGLELQRYLRSELGKKHPE